MAAYNPESMARAHGRMLPISFKQSIEICNSIRNRNANEAKKMLEQVAAMKKAIKFTRFNRDMGHKRKIGPGRYPVKASSEIMALIESAIANAQFKGLNTSELVICHVVANKGSKTQRYGRQRSRIAKRTNIDIFVQEKKTAGKESKADSGKSAVKATADVKETKAAAAGKKQEKAEAQHKEHMKSEEKK